MLYPTRKITYSVTPRLTRRLDPPASIDIVTIYEKLTGNPVRHCGNKIFALCPLHNDTHPTNFVLYPDSNSFYCFACAVGGDTYTLIEKIRECDFKEAVSIANEYGL